jgi:hypothetical protein
VVSSALLRLRHENLLAAAAGIPDSSVPPSSALLAGGLLIARRKNANDVNDVDGRVQAGISKAMTAANTAH